MSEAILREAFEIIRKINETQRLGELGRCDEAINILEGIRQDHQSVLVNQELRRFIEKLSASITSQKAKKLYNQGKHREACSLFVDIVESSGDYLKEEDRLKFKDQAALHLLDSGEYAKSYVMFKENASRRAELLDPKDRNLLSTELGQEIFAELQSSCEKNDDLTKLIVLINSGDLSGVNDMLKSGFDISRVTADKGSTPLHIAVNKNNIDIMESLLKHAHLKLIPSDLQNFINTRTTSVKGNTAMHIAASNGSLVALKVLLEYGAICRITNKRGETPHQLAKGTKVKSFLEVVE